MLIAQRRKYNLAGTPAEAPSRYMYTAKHEKKVLTTHISPKLGSLIMNRMTIKV